MIYVVQSGDSLTSIAKRYGVSLERLRSDNGLLPEQPLVPGQALVVFIPKETYQVRSETRSMALPGRRESRHGS